MSHMYRYSVLIDQKLGLNGVERTYKIVDAASIEEAEKHGIVMSAGAVPAYPGQ